MDSADLDWVRTGERLVDGGYPSVLLTRLAEVFGRVCDLCRVAKQALDAVLAFWRPRKLLDCLHQRPESRRVGVEKKRARTNNRPANFAPFFEDFQFFTSRPFCNGKLERVRKSAPPPLLGVIICNCNSNGGSGEGKSYRGREHGNCTAKCSGGSRAEQERRRVRRSGTSRHSTAILARRGRELQGSCNISLALSASVEVAVFS